jgi:hypothetical protein
MLMHKEAGFGPHIIEYKTHTLLSAILFFAVSSNSRHPVPLSPMSEV